MVGMLMTPAVLDYANRLKAAGMAVREDTAAGTVEVTDGETTVFKAIQKGRGGPWIVRYTDSTNVRWS